MGCVGGEEADDGRCELNAEIDRDARGAGVSTSKKNAYGAQKT